MLPLPGQGRAGRYVEQCHAFDMRRWRQAVAPKRHVPCSQGWWPPTSTYHRRPSPGSTWNWASRNARQAGG